MKKLQKTDYEVLADYVGHLTSSIYESVTRRLGFNHNDVRKKRFFREIDLREAEEMHNQIHRAYIKSICGLVSAELEIILESHRLGYSNRTPKTIRAIEDELLMRAIHDEED